MKDNRGLIYALAGFLALVVAILGVKSGARILSIASRLFIGAIGIIALLIVVIVALVIYFAFRDRVGKKSDTPASASLEREEKAIIDEAYSRLTQLRRTVSTIDSRMIHESAQQVCAQVEKILATLREKPDSLPKARQFLAYYLPTLEKILTKYREMERGGVADEEMKNKVVSCLSDIKSATDKQYRNLFDADILDLTAEMQVMTTICKRDGLVDDDKTQ